MRNVLGAASCVLLFVTATSNAFELRTHSRITESAIQRSVLAKDAKSISGRLGIDITDLTTLSERYFDVSGSTVVTRLATNYEDQRIPDVENVLSAGAWIVRGAIREDDLTPFGCFFNSVASSSPNECNPQDAPDNFNRVINHFLDPVSIAWAAPTSCRAAAWSISETSR